MVLLVHAILLISGIPFIQDSKNGGCWHMMHTCDAWSLVTGLALPSSKTFTEPRCIMHENSALWPNVFFCIYFCLNSYDIDATRTRGENAVWHFLTGFLSVGEIGPLHLEPPFHNAFSLCEQSFSYTPYPCEVRLQKKSVLVLFCLHGDGLLLHVHVDQLEVDRIYRNHGEISMICDAALQLMSHSGLVFPAASHFSRRGHWHTPLACAPIIGNNRVS